MKPLQVTHWAVAHHGWPGPPMKIVVLSDIHACDPWLPLTRVETIVEQAKTLQGDLVVLLGDYPGHLPFGTAAAPDAMAAILSRLSAPLGVWSVFGNHDWRDDPDAVARGEGETKWHAAFRSAGIGVLENASTCLSHGGTDVRLAGLGSQQALAKDEQHSLDGVDDIVASLNETRSDPTILLAHEPDIFADLPNHVLLTLSGHTHGGQIRLFGYAPVVPSHTGRRYPYGPFIQDGRHLIVSGGIGCSGLPLRIGQPPEITVVTMTRATE